MKRAFLGLVSLLAVASACVVESTEDEDIDEISGSATPRKGSFEDGEDLGTGGEGGCPSGTGDGGMSAVTTGSGEPTTGGGDPTTGGGDPTTGGGDPTTTSGGGGSTTTSGGGGSTGSGPTVYTPHDPLGCRYWMGCDPAR